VLHFKFALRVYRGNTVIVGRHETREYEFRDAAELACSMLRFMRPSCRRQVGAPSYPQSVNIDLPSLEGGYNNDVTVDILEVIAVDVPVLPDGDDEDQP